MCVKSFFGILVILTSMFCVSCAPVRVPPPEPEPKQGFLVNRSLGVSSAKQLDGAAVCLITGGKEELLVRDYFKKNGMTYESVLGENKNELTQMYKAGRCDVMVIFSNANVSSNDKVLPFE